MFNVIHTPSHTLGVQGCIKIIQILILINCFIHSNIQININLNHWVWLVIRTVCRCHIPEAVSLLLPPPLWQESLKPKAMESKTSTNKPSILWPAKLFTHFLKFSLLTSDKLRQSHYDNKLLNTSLQPWVFVSYNSSII